MTAHRSYFKHYRFLFLIIRINAEIKLFGSHEPPRRLLVRSCKRRLKFLIKKHLREKETSHVKTIVAPPCQCAMVTILSLLLVVLQVSSCLSTALDDYVNAPDPTYSYKALRQPYKGDGFTTYYINMTSQKWLTGRTL